MRKKLMPMVIVIAVFVVGCNVKYDFLQNTDEITIIEIVKIERIGKWDEQKQTCIIEQSAIGRVSNISSFLEEFRTVQCKSIVSHPKGVEEGDVAIKVIYTNGDYELIGRGGQANCINSKIYNVIGYSSFDENQFNTFVAKYIDD